MELELTEEQLKLISDELAKEELRLETIPKNGCILQIISCNENIMLLKELLEKKRFNVYDLNM